jgi:proteic killer suppression protein
MIENFKHKGLKRLFENGETKGIRTDHVEKIENVLAVLNRAASPNDMDLPGFKVHLLKGDRKGFYRVTVRANWRVIFRFEEGNACDVELIDYH